MTKINGVFVAIFLILITVSTIRLSIKHSLVFGDGMYYFAYVRQAVIDHNMDFKKSLTHFAIINNEKYVCHPTATGLCPNKFPPGSPIVWAGPYALTHAFVWLLHISKADGYSLIYQLAISFMSSALVVFGLYILFRYFQKKLNDTYAMLVVTLMLFGTNLLYYASIDTINSHPLSFFLSSALVTYVLSAKMKRAREYFFAGVLGGALALNRTQDFILILLPVALLYTHHDSYIKKIVSLLYLFLGAGLLFLPQIVAWNIIFGNPTTSPYFLAHEGFDLLHPHIIAIFLDNKVGIIPYTPLYLISAVGIIFASKKERPIARICVSIFFIAIYVIASWSTWYQGASYGVRMLISILPICAVLMSYAISALKNKYKYYLIIGSAAIMVYNACAIVMVIIHNYH